MLYQPEFLCGGLVFPESPRWHRGLFYCCSVDEGTIFCVDKAGNKEIIVQIRDWLSGWVFVGPDSDDIVLTSVFQRKLLMRDLSGLSEIADLSNLAAFGINTLVRARSDVMFIGSINSRFAKLGPCPVSNPLLCVDREGNASIASDEIGFANGMVITPDGKRLIVGDSTQACIHQWDLDTHGALSNHAIFARIKGSNPDGICLDAGGGIWVASGRDGVFRVLEGGEITDRVNMREAGATACMLGGDDGCTLLITATNGHDRKVVRDHPSGRLFTVEVDVPGAGLPSWY